MALARSRVTSQGQISVPAEVRRKLGVGPGSVLEWEEGDDGVLVRRAAGSTLDALHRAVFPDGPARHRALEELKGGIREYIRKKHARR